MYQTHFWYESGQRVGSLHENIDKKIIKKNFGDALLLPNWTFTLLSTMTPMAVEYFLIY